MNSKGVLGWLILAVALAVPAFMFWNWWKLLNRKPAEGGRKASAGPVFSGTKMAQGMGNPLAGSTATAAGAPDPGAGAPDPGAGAPGALPVAGSSGTLASVPAVPAAPAPGVPAAAPAASAASGAPPRPVSLPAVSTTPPAGMAAGPGMAVANAAPPAPGAAGGVAAMGLAKGEESTVRFAPKLDRDPTLSPVDIKNLARVALEKEWEQQKIKEEAERAAENERCKRLTRKELAKELADGRCKGFTLPKAPPKIDITTTVTLMGITAVPGSVTAIVAYGSDEPQIVRVGDRMKNGVQIVRMNPTAVWFRYKTKTWYRTVSKD